METSKRISIAILIFTIILSTSSSADPLEGFEHYDPSLKPKPLSAPTPKAHPPAPTPKAPLHPPPPMPKMGRRLTSVPQKPAPKPHPPAPSPKPRPPAPSPKAPKKGQRHESLLPPKPAPKPSPKPMAKPAPKPASRPAPKPTSPPPTPKMP